MSVFLGIDPGLDGALAVLGEDGALVVHDMPTLGVTRGGKNKRDVDVYELARLVDETLKTHPSPIAYVERVGAMKGQGVSSTFAFGKAYGVVIGILAGNFVRLEFVAPVTWKRAMGVTKDKDGARARASALSPRHCGLWPLVKHHGRAEAALIALYGATQA